jgi:hypothetical protein
MFLHVTSLLKGRLSAVRALASIGAVAGLAVVAGCNLDTTPTGPTGPQGLVQFINAAPRYGAVYLNVDTVTAVQGIGYGTGQAAYLAAPSTPRQFRVRNAGDTTTIASGQLQVANQTVYTMILTQHPVGGGLLIYQDTVSSPPVNQIGLRVVNAAPSAGNVDVYVTGADTSLTTPTAVNIPFEGSSVYVNVPAGAVHVRITTAGTKTVLLDVDASQLTVGLVRTVLLIDAVGGGLPLNWLSIPDRG